MPGPRVRTDVLDVYVFRLRGQCAELLQLRRVEQPLADTWQPVMGHCEDGEPATDAMWRELTEETSLDATDTLGAWALEGVHPFYLPSRDAIMLSPRFAVRAPLDWEPTLNEEHDTHRWVQERDVATAFMWPGQRAAIEELLEITRRPEGDAARAQRISPPTKGA